MTNIILITSGLSWEYKFLKMIWRETDAGKISYAPGGRNPAQFAIPIRNLSTFPFLIS